MLQLIPPSNQNSLHNCGRRHSVFPAMEPARWDLPQSEDASASYVILGPSPRGHNSGVSRVPARQSWASHRVLGICGQTDEHAGSSAEQPARRHTSPTLALLEVDSAWFRHIEDDRQLDGYKERKRKNAEPFLSPCDLYQASVCFETFLAEFAAFSV